MKISVAMCTYNGEKYLKQQIDSIFSQTLLPDEIIICDDCSNDNTKLLLERMKNSLIKVHHNSVNLGSTRNFEQAIKMCSGDIIVLSDQDDVWINTKIETILNFMNQRPDIYCVFSNAFVTDEQLNPFEASLWDCVDFNYKKFNGNTLFRRNVVTGATMAFKKEALEFVFPISTDFVHDEWIALITSILYPNGIVPINENLIYYRQHSSQQLGINLKINKPFVKFRNNVIGVSVRHYIKNNTLLKLKKVEKHLEKLNCKTSYKEFNEYITYLENRINICECENKIQRLKLIKRDFSKYAKFDSPFLALKDLVFIKMKK